MKNDVKEVVEAAGNVVENAVQGLDEGFKKHGHNLMDEAEESMHTAKDIVSSNIPSMSGVTGSVTVIAAGGLAIVLVYLAASRFSGD
jgi:hypothetical protein